MQKLLLKISFTAYNALPFLYKSTYTLNILHIHLKYLSNLTRGSSVILSNERRRCWNTVPIAILAGHSAPSVKKFLTQIIARFVTKDLTEQ